MTNFENKIKTYLCDGNAEVTGSEVRKNSLGSTMLCVNYTISDEYAEEHELFCKNREMKIMLLRAVGDESADITSYGIN